MDVGSCPNENAYIQPPFNITNIFNLNSTDDKIFLKCKITNEIGELKPFYVLPDSGNRARCILRFDIFQKLYPNGKLIPIEEKITTAKKGDYLEIMGQTENQVEFWFANQQYGYKCRPFVVKKLQLPCLLSAHDMSQMKMIVDHNKHTVLLGGKGLPEKLIPCPEDFKIPVITVNNTIINPMEEAIIEVEIGIRSPPSVNLLIQPTDEFLQTYHVDCLESLDSGKTNGTSHVTVVNFTDHPIHIKAGIEIGTATTVNTVDRDWKKPSEIKDQGKLSLRDLRKKYRKEFQLDKNSHLTEEQKNQLLKVLCDYQDVISSGPADIGKCEEVKCHIPTEEGKTVKSQCRPLPPHLKENLKEQLNAWIDKGVVEKASSACPFSSPLVPVKKKNGQIRWAVDFRRLNNISQKDHRPIPNVFERLSSLKATVRKPLRYYGCLDLQDAFHNIPIAEEDRDKAAVITPFGLYRFLRMPFGLHGAPQAFAELIGKLEDKLAQFGKLSQQILIYFDDCLLCAETFEEFLQLLELFLSVLRKMNLKVNPNKCQLGLPSIKWLGHEVSNDGIRPAQELTQTIINWPSPKNITELRALFGTFSYYRRFIPRFAERTTQMRKLLQNNVDFKWTEKQEKEMDDLKEALCSKPILGHPDFTKQANPFILYVDSSKTGVGAVIAQKQVIEHDGQNKEIEVVIAYGSRTLTAGEQHYSAYKKELLGMVYAINHFRYYLFGKNFIVRTDHRALEWLLKTKTANAPSLLYRWQDILAEYDFTIEYVPGTKMAHVDGLSRKGNQNDGTIKDLPDLDEAAQSLNDEFWLTKFRVKENKAASSVNAIDRPKRTTKPSSRYPPSEYVDLPQHFYQITTPTLQEDTDVISTPPVSPNPQMEPLLLDPDTLELDFNEDFDLPALELEREEDNPADQNESTITEQSPTSAKDNEEVSFDEILQDAQRNNPSMKTILEDLLPITNNKNRQGRKPNKIPSVSKKVFKMLFHRNNAPHVDSYWTVWEKNEFKLDKERQVLIRWSPLPESEGKGYRKLLVIPEELKNVLISAAHDDPSVIHPGGQTTYKIIRDRAWWPNMREEIQDYVNNCNDCKNKNRKPNNNTDELGKTTSSNYRSLTRWSMDVVSLKRAHGPNGFCKLLTLMDYNTRWLEAFPMTNDKSSSIIRVLRSHFLPRYGLGCHFVADNGSSFISEELKQLMKQLGSITTHTIPYNPQSNPVERSHRTINEKLRISLEERNESHWLDYLPNVLLAIRTTPSTVTGTSPYFSIFGQQPTLAIDLMCQPNRKKLESTTTEEGENTEPLTMSVNSMAKKLMIIKKNQQLSNQKIQHRHNQNQAQLAKKCQRPIFFNQGETVDLWRPYDIKNPLASRRFARYWSGPYVVLKHNPDKPHLVTIKIGNNGESRNVFVNHLRRHGKKPTGLWHQLPIGFHPCAPPLQNKCEFNMPHRLRNLSIERKATKRVNPDVLEELNAPNPGYELGLAEFNPNQIGQFKTFYDWSQNKHQGEDSEAESYYLPGNNEPIEFIAESDTFEIVEEDEPIDEPEPINEQQPHPTQPDNEELIQIDPTNPPQMDFTPQRSKRTFEEILSPPSGLQLPISSKKYKKEN